MNALNFARPIGPSRFRQCGECRGSGEVEGQDTWDSDAIANSTDCPSCGGTGGDYFPLHGYTFDALPKMTAARTRYLTNRHNSSPEWSFVSPHSRTVGEVVALQYGAARQLAVSPLDRPLPGADA
ncbi:MAG: hypothetical protein ACTS5I_09120 [Rhodanobacter sp.]